MLYLPLGRIKLKISIETDPVLLIFHLWELALKKIVTIMTFDLGYKHIVPVYFHFKILTLLNTKNVNPL